ncbi:PROTEIN FAR1-RELATED SEQUENCE 8 [Salix koriyanagi]|uniref:Protein FAR1-RELATED SEQUENCE n=1 Tax=Salix koriyanagi TaxID=2511006 RepID=A0A9Q0T0D4_9ROSI|nr:PROTEIN FAR1-RELATED SEQUENCE 8 [Salix koriyanagi]
MIEEGSQNSEQLLEEEGDDLEFDSNDLEIEGDDPGIEDNDLGIEDNNLEQDKNLGIEGHDLPEGNDLEDNCEQLFDIEYHVLENNRDDATLEVQNGDFLGKDYPPPVLGMEFESYDDAYNYYNCYAKDLGFAIRVKSSWTKRNSKEKRGAVLCCNCEGFKTSKEAHSRRKETRTGCLAMLRLRLVESNRWRVDEVKLEHNHLFDPARAQNSKSHKKMDAGAKRKVEPTVDVEVRTIKLYRTAAVDPLGYGSTNSNEGESSQHVDRSKRLKLKKGDAHIIHDYFCKVQLRNPNFFYLMDLNDEGAWLTCMLGRPPQTIITEQCKAMQSAIAEVFPRAHHRFCLSRVVHRIFDNLGTLPDYEGFQRTLNVAIHDSLKVDEFEMAWEDMIQRFGIADNECLRACYEDRERWAPVYSKDTCFAGISTLLKDGSIRFFNGYVNQQTTLKEFFDMNEIILQKKYQKEALDDFESRHSSPILRTGSFYELQLSRVYTNEIFKRFQDEVQMMSSCFSITQVHANGPLITYMIKERQDEENLRDIKNFEVMYDKRGAEVRCICSCFNSKGYLCRHALCILNYNGVEQIPPPYISARWRKDLKRLYVPDSGSNNIDVANPVQWFDHLYRRALQVVEEGMISEDRYMVAWQAFKESLNKMLFCPS